MDRKLFRTLRNNFLTGVIVVLPLFITLILIKFLFARTDAIILEPSAKIFAFYVSNIASSKYLIFAFKALVFVCVILIISLIGSATKNILGKRLISFTERAILKFPVFGRIYAGTKEISNAFLLSNKGPFMKVVLAEFPKEGSYALGFITSEAKGEIQDKTKDNVFSVLIPTTPNPTSGFLLFIPMDKLIFLDMTIEEGIKLIISGGIAYKSVSAKDLKA